MADYSELPNPDDIPRRIRGATMNPPKAANHPLGSMGVVHEDHSGAVSGGRRRSKRGGSKCRRSKRGGSKRGGSKCRRSKCRRSKRSHY